MKPVVHYKSAEGKILVGNPAIVRPIDHPSDMVSNKKHVLTSPVIKHDEDTGSFETENTRYQLMTEEV